MALPKLPKLSAGSLTQDLVSNKVASATSQVEATEKELAEKISAASEKTAIKQAAEGKLQELKARRASQAEISAATSALASATADLDVAGAASAAAAQAAEAAEQLKTASLARMNLAVLDDIEMPDVSINLPSISPATIMGMLPSLPSLPDFPPKISISIKSLLNPSMGFPSLEDIPDVPGLPALPAVPEIPAAIKTVLNLPAKTGNVSGPTGSFSAGTNISTNLIATETVMAPDMVVEKSMTVPTIIGGNIASTSTLNLAATTGITATAPTVALTGVTAITGATTVTGNLTVVGNLAVTPYAVTAALKAFDIEHPTKEGKRLQYACLEGPEAAVYVRGKTSEGIIPLPDYWHGLVDDKTITVHLTPTNMDQNLVVNNVNRLSIQVLGNHQLPYYYYVMAERKDIDKLTVEYDA